MKKQPGPVDLTEKQWERIAVCLIGNKDVLGIAAILRRIGSMGRKAYERGTKAHPKEKHI